MRSYSNRLTISKLSINSPFKNVSFLSKRPFRTYAHILQAAHLLYFIFYLIISHITLAASGFDVAERWREQTEARSSGRAKDVQVSYDL